MLEFFDFGLYFVQDENDFTNPLLQVGSGSGSDEKSTGSGSGGLNINGSDRIRILIPARMCLVHEIIESYLSTSNQIISDP